MQIKGIQKNDNILWRMLMMFLNADSNNKIRTNFYVKNNIPIL